MAGEKQLTSIGHWTRRRQSRRLETQKRDQKGLFILFELRVVLSYG